MYIDQKITLQKIIEQDIEMNTCMPLFINLINSKKAFEIIYGYIGTLWKICAAYGIPIKILNLIKTFYSQFEYITIIEHSISEPFSIRSGLRQSYINSPIQSPTKHNTEKELYSMDYV